MVKFNVTCVSLMSIFFFGVKVGDTTTDNEMLISSISRCTDPKSPRCVYVFAGGEVFR
jgi:hypothetical protein